MEVWELWEFDSVECKWVCVGTTWHEEKAAEYIEDGEYLGLVRRVELIESR